MIRITKVHTMTVRLITHRHPHQTSPVTLSASLPLRNRLRANVGRLYDDITYLSDHRPSRHNPTARRHMRDPGPRRGTNSSR